MTGKITYSFIKAIIRNELMFNCYYLHNYHLRIGPFFKMVRKGKAAKKLRIEKSYCQQWLGDIGTASQKI